MILRMGLFFLFLQTMLWGVGVAAQQPDQAPLFEVFVDEAAGLAVNDGGAEFDVLFQIPEKHLLYKEKVLVEVDNPGVDVVVVKPSGVIKYDEFFAKETEVYYNQLAVLVKLKFHEGFDFSQNLIGRVYYQGCSETICYRMMHQSFSLALVGGVSKEVAASQKPIKNQGGLWQSVKNVRDFRDLLAQGFWIALSLTFLAGLLTGFTPCVLPVIPLTLAFIGVSPRESASHRVRNLLFFVLGLVMMYTALGVASAVLGQTLGFVYQSQVFLLFLAGFMLIMGLWMLDVVRFQVPASFQNAVVKVQPQGVLKYLYAGLTIGFLAAPCVGPILGPLLVYISSTQDVVLGSVMMMAYALGLSVLFFVLGFFSRDWIARFSSGSRLVKRFFGVLLLLVAAYYGSVFWSQQVQPAQTESSFFETNLQTAFDKAQKQGKGVLVDFYADWCLPCHEWDRRVWSDQALQQKLSQNWVPVKIDCTKETPECSEAIQKFKVIGWPTVLFLDPKLNEIASKRLVGVVLSIEELLQHLE